MAKADLEQNAEQENDSELTAVGTPGEFEQFEQSQASLQQFNLNAQIGFANAEAYSDYVEVGQSGSLAAGGTGIIATSEAVALADLDQKVEQDNENEVSGTGAFQRQPGNSGNSGVEQVEEGEQAGVEQDNINLQFGVANAEAYADEVKVRNLEDPSHEDGINAESKAVAVAKLDQNVDQDNENKLSGGTIAQQSVDQSNDSEQIASPEHESISRPTVSQGTAPVEQTTAPADQTTAPTEPVVKGGQPVTQGPDPVVPDPVEPSDPPSGQNPPADPTAEPASVVEGPAAPVDPTAPVEFGVAPVELGVAPVELTTQQQAPQQAEVPSSDVTSTPVEQLAGPGQGPVGMSGQDQAGFGGANAEAYSDDVLVEKNGKLSVDGDGIDAESKAVAIAKVEQEAEQENENSQETSGGDNSKFVQQQANDAAA